MAIWVLLARSWNNEESPNLYHFVLETGHVEVESFLLRPRGHAIAAYTLLDYESLAHDIPLSPASCCKSKPQGFIRTAVQAKYLW